MQIASGDKLPLTQLELREKIKTIENTSWKEAINNTAKAIAAEYLKRKGRKNGL